jgi:UDP-3-O-[3-hydroxymyristoyl] glucosamine N-acyltransferase
VVLAGQVGVAGHITIGDGVRVGAKSGVAKSIPAGQTVSGITTMPHQTWLRTRALIQRLPETVKQIKSLEERIRLLEAEIDELRRKDHGDE